MNKYLILMLLASLLPGSIGHAAEQPLPAQLAQIEALQHRADVLALGEVGPHNYHLAKARTWLDMALSEYHENEQNGIVEAIIAEIVPLLDALEKQQNDISMDTPRQVTGSEAVRDDLWELIAGIKTSASFSCGQRQIAEAEVHLVWAGHEKLESSWEHASSYAQSAEELIREARGKIDACELVKNPPISEKITLSSDALFEFGDARLSPSAQWRLSQLADRIKQEGARLQEVMLVGHTDRLRSDGHQERNQILSEQRAESIRQYLIAQGIAEDKIQAIGAGSSQPLVECATRQSKARQIACLTPNRRVEIILRGVK
jgi:outer membrane protein OmpA-like peptidoglycan-associated protein